MKNKTNGKVFYAIAEDVTSSAAYSLASVPKDYNKELKLEAEDFLVDINWNTLFDSKKEALDAIEDDRIQPQHEDSTKYLVEVKVIKVSKLETKVVETEIK